MAPPSSASGADARLAELRLWVRAGLGGEADELVPVSGDASFRRYFRHVRGDQSWIAMDAPPEYETCDEFVAIARHLHALGLNVPQVVAADLKRGFLLLTDLGSTHYLDALDEHSADRLYGAALDALEQLQLDADLAAQLPAYDHDLLMREMALFPDWLLARHLDMDGEEAATLLADSFERLAAAALEQPVVVVHRDYHSRNLMVTAQNLPGILDFQDAVRGPLTYDLVSLFTDAYIAWPRERVEGWLAAYMNRPRIKALTGGASREQWLRWFDLMALQRHLKVAGIFARLWYRDGKAGYLKDIPRSVGYLADITARYPEFADLHKLLTERVVPALQARGAV